jgi:hypothetical protein
MTSHLKRVALVALVAAAPLGAQTLERRVNAVNDGAVQFHFAARTGVCGDGRSFIRSEEDGFYGSWSSDGMRSEVCGAGPVRVVISKAGRDVVKIDAYAGPLQADAAAGQDLGAVGAREAVSYLLGLASSLEGRPAREAVFPAMLADSASVTPQLLAMLKDQSKTRDIRRATMSWLARRRNENGGVGAAAVSKALEVVVRDRNESESLRQTALSTISGFNRGEGIPTLLAFAADNEAWLAKQATQTLSRSGDPRARAFTRDAVRNNALPDETRVAAIQGLGNEYATPADLKLLREVYGTLDNDRARDAVISTLSTAGGRENTDWLLALASSPTETTQRRRRVLSLLGRSDDPRVKDALKAMVDR